MTTLHQAWPAAQAMLKSIFLVCVAVFCMIATKPSYALNWSNVVEIAQSFGSPSANVTDTSAGASTPLINGESNMGTRASGDSSFKCPSAGGEIYLAGFSNAFDDIELTGGCTCKVECCYFFGCLKLPTVGVVLKAWQGSQFLEVVRHRGCSPSLFGIDLPYVGFAKAARSAGGEDGFYHVHAMPNYGLAALAAVNEALCHIPAIADSTIYLSEIDFSWNPANGSPDLANPLSLPDVIAADGIFIAKKYLWMKEQETAVIAQNIENLACVGECLFITGGGDPISALGNCSGCNGLVAPYNGKATAVGGRRAAELLAHRFVNLMMNRGWRSTTTSAVYCNAGLPRGSPAFPKNEFRLQSVYPAEEGRMRKFGAPFVPISDERGKQGQLNEQDYVFILWKRRECCASARYCAPIPS
jgi:conjugal transfer pilus assembly protein TraU